MTYKKLLHAFMAICVITCATSFAEPNTKIEQSEYKPVFAWPVDAPNKVTIKGSAELTEEQMVAYIKANTSKTLLNCSVEDIVHYYYREGKIEGVRADIALCQAIKETGWFCYGGTVVPEQNNFCGLGTTSSTVKGHYFDTPEIGVRAHIHHLLVYAQKQYPIQELADPRFKLVIDKYPEYHGNMKHWTDLNGRWAVPGKHYGEEILLLWDAAKNGNHNAGLLDSIKEKTKSNPDNYDTWYAYAKLANNLGQYKDAVKAYNKLIVMEPKQASPYLELASLYNDWGFDSKAIEVYDKLLVIDPLNKDAIRGKAYEMAFLGKNRSAAVLYSQVLRLDDKDTLALYNRGNILKKLGRTTAGETDLAAYERLRK